MAEHVITDKEADEIIEAAGGMEKAELIVKSLTQKVMSGVKCKCGGEMKCNKCGKALDTTDDADKLSKETTVDTKSNGDKTEQCPSCGSRKIKETKSTKPGSTQRWFDCKECGNQWEVGGKKSATTDATAPKIELESKVEKAEDDEEESEEGIKLHEDDESSSSSENVKAVPSIELE